MCMGHFERRIHGIDAANEVVMLRGSAEWNQLLASNSEEDAPRAATQRPNSAVRAGNLDPKITGRCGPGRPAQAKDGRGGLSGGHRCVGGYCFSVRMRSVDQEIDPLGSQILCESFSASKPADPYGTA